MEKKQVTITKKLVNYTCKVCHRTVYVAQAKPWIIETDKSIIHSWDYGHRHDRKFDLLNGEQFQVEDTIDYE